MNIIFVPWILISELLPFKGRYITVNYTWAVFSLSGREGMEEWRAHVTSIWQQANSYKLVSNALIKTKISIN